METMFFMMILSAFLPRVKPIHKKSSDYAVGSLFKNNNWSLGFWLLVVFYKSPEYLMIGLLPDFLINSLHMSLTQLGSLQKIYGMVLAIFGGFLMVRLTHDNSIERLLKLGLCMQAVTAILYFLASHAQSIPWASAAILFDNFAYGMATTAFGTFLMQNCERKFAATQFAMLTSMSMILRHLAGPIDVWLVSFSWDNLFMVVGVLALVILACSEKMLARLNT